MSFGITMQTCQHNRRKLSKIAEEGNSVRLYKNKNRHIKVIKLKWKRRSQKQCTGIH